MVALLVLRKTQKDTPRPYRVPTVVPYCVLLISMFLTVFSVIDDPSMKYVTAILLILIGVGVYTIFVYHRKTPTTLLRKFTFLTQMLFQCVPPNTRDD
ncbi:jg2685 [Pararge aegeria aegeria]|uniref:Jg2685 protein n=5 Tax=Pararge aegeria TaxID=116150 RepID=A0A8S4QW72_9NEOP|nr:jg2685 [Pararge aegeria aegeria]